MTTPEHSDDEPTSRPAGFPSTVLALVERGAPDDGLAYTGLLFERALRELAPRCRTITVFPREDGAADASFMQRGLFKARLMSAGRRADCVVFNHVGVATAQAGVPSGLRRPYCVIVHGAEAWETSADGARRRALEGAALILANSAYTARRIAEAYPDARTTEVCTPTLLPDAEGGAVDGALVSTITARTIVIAGRMSAAAPHKGHDALLESWPAVLARRPDARLAIVGRGDDAKRLEAKATRLGVMGSLRFTGFVTEATLDAMLARAGGYAQPSQAAGSALGLLRAMRAGLPCIAAAHDAGAEAVEDGVSGVTVDTSQPEALAQAIIGLLGDSVRRRAMGDAGRARFESTFSFDRFRERVDCAMRDAFPPRAAS